MLSPKDLLFLLVNTIKSLLTTGKATIRSSTTKLLSIASTLTSKTRSKLTKKKNKAATPEPATAEEERTTTGQENWETEMVEMPRRASEEARAEGVTRQEAGEGEVSEVRRGVGEVEKKEEAEAEKTKVDAEGGAVV